MAISKSTLLCSCDNFEGQWQNYSTKVLSKIQSAGISDIFGRLSYQLLRTMLCNRLGVLFFGSILPAETVVAFCFPHVALKSQLKYNTGKIEFINQTSIGKFIA